MAFSLSATTTTSCNFTSSSSPFFPPPASHFSCSIINKSFISIDKIKNPTVKFVCKAKDCSDESPKTEKIQGLKFDRRDFLLFGLGSTGIIYNTEASLGMSPDFLNCVDAAKPDGTPINCCPTSRPAAAEITDFVPWATGPTRVRVATQSFASFSVLSKYRKAIELLKQLPTSDPRNFMQQANVHCAYCNGGYNQEGYSNLKFEIHRSWLFFPFHRWYLYFFERICAKVLQDETFALPFWNWDSPFGGMEIPAMFNVVDSPLYDRLRNQEHLPPAIVDLNWSFSDNNDISPEDQTRYNLYIMYKQMITNATTPRLFMGQPYRTGDDITVANGPGSIEVAPHNTVHEWTGDPKEPFNEPVFLNNEEHRDTSQRSTEDKVEFVHTLQDVFKDKKVLNRACEILL